MLFRSLWQVAFSPGSPSFMYVTYAALDGAWTLAEYPFDGSVADAVLGPTYLDHAHPEVIGPAAVRSLVPRFHSANPETRMSIAFAAADAEFVAVRNTISRSLGGASVSSEGIALFRVLDGKLAEQWSCYPDVEAQRSPLAAARASLDVWLSFRA